MINYCLIFQKYDVNIILLSRIIHNLSVEGPIKMKKGIKNEVGFFDSRTLDKPVFVISVCFIVLLVLALFLFPTETSAGMLAAKNFVVNKIGFIYTWAGIGAVALVMYFSFSRYGNIKFGAPDEKPEYGEFVWAATLFTAGNAAALLYWAPIEWTEYFRAPALGIEPMSWQAAEWSGAYTFFHWGLIPWSLYAITALPVAYCYFVRKTPVLKVSETCREILGRHSDGWAGKLLDILFILAMIMGTTTELGISIPFITTAFCGLVGAEPSMTLMMVVLGVTTVVFSLAACTGLKKGVAKLGDGSYKLSLLILIFIFVFGPTTFIIKMSTTSVGLFAQNFVRMATWMDPILNGGFAEAWTQFYWAWWMSASMFMGLFIARLSRGRTVRKVLMGSVMYGTLGAGVFFWIMGGFTMNLQFSGKYDIIGKIEEIGANSAIMESLRQLPLGNVVILAIAVCGVLFLATTYDASATSIAAVSQTHLKQGQDPNSKLVLFWSILMVLIPAGILYINGPFETLQAATIVGSLPVAFVMILEIAAFVKMVRNDSTIT